MTRRHGFDGMRGTPSACSCRAVAAFALALLAVGLAGMVLLPAHADAAPRKFRNCTAMHKVYKYGVAKSRAAARKAGRSAKVSRALYLEHRALDRDSDGVACERARKKRKKWSNPPAGRCINVTSYDWNWQNDMKCRRWDGTIFYTDYAGADAFQR